MTGFEPRTSGVTSDLYANCATTTAQYFVDLGNNRKKPKRNLAKMC